MNINELPGHQCFFHKTPDQQCFSRGPGLPSFNKGPIHRCFNPLRASVVLVGPLSIVINLQWALFSLFWLLDNFLSPSMIISVDCRVKFPSSIGLIRWLFL